MRSVHPMLATLCLLVPLLAGFQPADAQVAIAIRPVIPVEPVIAPMPRVGIAPEMQPFSNLREVLTTRSPIGFLNPFRGGRGNQAAELSNDNKAINLDCTIQLLYLEGVMHFVS